MHSRHLRTAIRAAAAAVALWPVAASAQVDPLLFLKDRKPNVIIAIDTGNRMMRDPDLRYYDANLYTKNGDAWEVPLGVTPLNTSARFYRRYVNLVNTDSGAGSDKFTADRIEIVGDLQLEFSTHFARTRLALARAAASAAITDNMSVARFGLIKMRQDSPAWGSEGNEGPVVVADVTQQPVTDLTSGKWKITRPTVSALNGSISAVTAPLVLADSPTANTDVQTILARDIGVANGLTAGGKDSKNVVDAPVDYMLDDIRAEALRLITADTQCRNTVAVMIVGGADGNSVTGSNTSTKASTFLSVTGGHRVPVYVIALFPAAADVASLQAIAANSGGQYFEITKAMIEEVAVGSPVPAIQHAINVAVQHAFAAQTDFDTAPSASQPYGPQTEYPVTSPIVGTVNLKNAKDIEGNPLGNTNVLDRSDNVIPQRSNVLVTTALAVPGFEAKLRAFRTYIPVPDSTTASGYKFSSIGTRLWVASVPAAASRNIYTVLPDGTEVAFTTSNAATLAPYLNTYDASALITWTRSQPLGGVVSSTPAIMDPPSVDPPPDEAYPEFANTNKDRRGLIFIGTNDGMLHAIDSRLGVEVWAFIPFNLLPKLKAYRDGQGVDKFTFFVDSSPKVADVKVGGAWKTYLICGQGPGGTFYQTFDVTLPNMSASVAPDTDNISTVLAYFSVPGRIVFKWSFPRYSEFDHTAAPYGDLKSTASDVEKTVGQTWSDPAVGQIQDDDGKFAVLAGSGFLPYTTQQAANRGGALAGTTFYLLKIDDGTVFDNRSVGNDNLAEDVDNCVTVNNCTRMKNALQADPVATGPPDSRFITKAYIGDLDGNVWRFDLGTNASTGNPQITAAPLRLHAAGAAHPLFSSMAAVNVGATQQYIFFGTGSDLLPINGVNQSYKLLGVLDQGSSGALKFSRDLVLTNGAGDDEKVTAFPAVAGDIVFFTTTSFKPADPCALPDANLYALTFIGGAAYDNTGDNTITAADTPIVRTVAGARATAPFIVDQHLSFVAGGKVQLFGDPNDYNNGVGQVSIRILSWREVR